METFCRTKEQYQLTVSPQTYFQVYKIDYLKDNDLELYDERMNTTHIHHPKITKIQNKTLYYLVTLEHTPHRLEDINGNLKTKTQRPIVNMVAEAVLGFEALYKKFGPFKVKSTLIGFDKKWIVKVWINNNFAKNHFNPFDHCASDSQETMIQNIITIFQQHGYEDKEVKSLTSFKEAIRVLHGKVSQQIKNQLSNALHDKAKQKLKAKDKGDSQMPTTPKNKARDEISYSDKGKFNRQSNVDVPEKTNLQHKISKIPKISEETSIPHSEKKPNIYHAQTTSNKDLYQSCRQDYSISNDDFLIIRRQIEIPESTDQASVKQFLGCSIHTYQAKMKFINCILESKQAIIRVKQLAHIFEYALTKDPDLYKSLLTEKGNIVSLNEGDKQKVNKIRKLRQPNLYPKLMKPPSETEHKDKEAHDYYCTSKISQDLDDVARKNMHLAPTEIGYPPICNRPTAKVFTIKQGGFRPFNINSDRIQIPSRIKPSDEFAISHSDIPLRPDYKASYGVSNKQQIQPRSHQKNSYDNSSRQQKFLTSQITVAKNPKNQTNNFRDQVFKFVAKQ